GVALPPPAVGPRLEHLHPAHDVVAQRGDVELLARRGLVELVGPDTGEHRRGGVERGGEEVEVVVVHGTTVGRSAPTPRPRRRRAPAPTRSDATPRTAARPRRSPPNKVT